MKVLRNVLWVYAQRIFTGVITLFSTPIILKNLGVEDYGIYTLTLGLVALFGFINWSLTTSTQRFIAVDIGKSKDSEISRTFTTSFFIHLGYGVLIFLIILFFGYFFTKEILDIPENKIRLAQKIMIFVGIISLMQMVSIPLQGLLKAYENLRLVSILGILDSSLKLISAALLFLSPINKLMFFSMLMSLSAFFVFAVNLIYCIKNYSVVSFSIENFNRNKFKEMMGFTSWNIIGAVAILGRNQGVGIVLNIFFGVIANAAYGVALQIQAALGVFSQGIVAAMTPRILKNAGKYEVKQMIGNAYLTSKYSLYALSFIFIPLMIKMEKILTIWLDVLPENSVIFSRLVILFLFLTSFSIGIQAIFQGINRVKTYNISISLIILMNIPISICLFYLKYPAFTIFIVSIVLEIVSFLVRLYLLKKYLDFDPFGYLIKFFKEVLAPIGVIIIILSILNSIWADTILNLVLITLLSSLLLVLFLYIFAMDEREQNLLKLKFITKIKA